jgi:hypothetical protein
MKEGRKMFLFFEGRKEKEGRKEERKEGRKGRT